MQIPYYDPKKEHRAVVGTYDCPTCDFRSGSKHSADLLNNGRLRCSKCGVVLLGDNLLCQRTFKPNSLIRQLVHVAAPILDHLGTGDLDRDHWDFIYLLGARRFLVARQVDGGEVRLEFHVTYESDCQIAAGIGATTPAKDRVGGAWDRRHFETMRSPKPLTPGVAALFDKLTAEHFNVWGTELQRWGSVSWVKGNYHWNAAKTAGGVRGVFVDVTWR